MNDQKYILDRINSGQILKHSERDMSVFFTSSLADSHIQMNAPRFGNNTITIAFMIYYKQVNRYYRLIEDNEHFLASIANNIAKDMSVKDDIFNGYNQAGDRLMYLYAEIDSREDFDAKFVRDLSEAVHAIGPWQIAIMHRAESLDDAFKMTPEVPKEIYDTRKRNEMAFGLFQTKFEVMCSKILKKIDNMTLVDFKYLTADDIVNVLETGKRPDKIIEERKSLVIMNLLPEFEIMTGDKAEQIFEAIRNNEEKYSPTKGVTEIKGSTVFGKEKVRGKAQVITDYDTIESFEEDNILVTPSTLPKYNHIYKRAKAIITDEGGILAHASIVCREFKVPGIIGTKVATKVIKSGDIIELDTEKGTITIIK
jgi:phosphohistidine swiveling domain-containing protein